MPCHGPQYRIGVTDDAFYRPNHPGLARRQPTAGEPIWSFRQEHVTWSCELRFHGESWGWEAQILREGELVIGRRFDTKALAEQSAELEKQAIENRE